jgi:hypothetical protein
MPQLRNLLNGILLSLCLALPLHGQDPGDEFRDTIRSQLEAFEVDDFTAAFQYAAPVIQNIFRTPENFGAMVRNGYPMVWRPGEVKFLDLHPRDGGIWQKVMITDQSGAIHVLDYEMVPTPDGLRIGGVEVLKLPDLGA